MSEYVDVNVPETWPAAVFQHASALAEKFKGTAEYTSDLKIMGEDEDRFRSMFADIPVRVYHATRLLEHEIAAIRANGLRLLTLDLVDERIEAAFRSSHISSVQRDQLAKSHVFALDRANYREGQICFTLPENALRESPDTVWRLLANWGGEAIYWASETHGFADLVRGLGKPAVVVADLDLSGDWSVYKSFPAIEQLFVGRLLNLKQVWSDLFYHASVNSERIADIWHPGNANYDQFAELPRA